VLKSILVPIETSPSTDAQIETAARVAKIFGSRVDGLAPRWLIGPGSFGAEFPGMTATLPMDFSDDEQSERIASAAKAFREGMERNGIKLAATAAADGPSARWLDVTGSGDEAVGEVARLYSISILPRPVANQILPRAPLLETVLFGSGRPVLATPPEVPDRIGETVLIPWNGSTETSRAIQFAMPFLVRAKRVIVLDVEGGHVGGPTSEDLATALKTEGIAAELVPAKSNGQTAGEVILREANNLKADMLLKGAYTRSRLRQLFFGGVTSHIMANASVPVLFAH